MSKRKIAYISGGILLAPVVLVVLLAIALYLPPVQRWAVDKACAWAEENTGYRVKIGEVRLAFPLDLRLGEVTALDNVGDTLLLCDELTLSVPVRPLFDCRVDGDGELGEIGNAVKRRRSERERTAKRSLAVWIGENARKT